MAQLTVDIFTRKLLGRWQSSSMWNAILLYCYTAILLYCHTAILLYYYTHIHSPSMCMWLVAPTHLGGSGHAPPSKRRWHLSPIEWRWILSFHLGIQMHMLCIRSQISEFKCAGLNRKSICNPEEFQRTSIYNIT